MKEGNGVKRRPQKIISIDPRGQAVIRTIDARNVIAWLGPLTQAIDMAMDVGLTPPDGLTIWLLALAVRRRTRAVQNREYWNFIAGSVK